MPGLTHWQSPNFMAFFPAGATYPSMLGELYSAAFTAPAFNWLCSPACTELETVVLDWLCKALALPDCYLSTSPGGGGGVLQGSASEAVVTVMVAAREKRVRELVDAEQLEEGSKERDERMYELRSKMIALGSDQAHSSTAKAAIIAGVRFRKVPTRLQDNFEMTGESLRVTLQECRRDGLEPFYLTTSMGTTNTCAVDRLEEIKKVKEQWPGVWIHVDAAYAGAALVCEEFQHYTKATDAFDSFEMNMHKWLLVNFDAGCLFVKHRSDLTRALSITPTYLQNSFTDSGLVTDYRDWQIPLGRRFRALKVWFVMRTYGLQGMQAHIRKSLAIGDVFHSLVKGRRDLFEVVTPPAFALTVFRVKPSAVAESSNVKGVNSEAWAGDFTPDAGRQGEAEATEVTKQVYELINSRGEIFITSTVVADIYCMRVVSGNPMAEEKYVRNAFDIIVKTIMEILSKRKENSASSRNTRARL